MKLKNTVNKLAKQAFDIVGDLKVPVEYHHISMLGSYDPAIDKITTTETVLNTEGILTNISEKELDWSPIGTDGQKVLLPGIEFNFEPINADYMIIEGNKWEVKGIRRVPGDALLIFFVQAA